MSINIIDNYSVNVSKPMDSRIVVSGTASRAAIPYKYDGLRVFDTVDRRSYVWNINTSNWDADNSNMLDGYVPIYSSTYGLTNSTINTSGGFLNINGVPGVVLKTNGNIFIHSSIALSDGANVWSDFSTSPLIKLNLNTTYISLTPSNILATSGSSRLKLTDGLNIFGDSSTSPFIQINAGGTIITLDNVSGVNPGIKLQTPLTQSSTTMAANHTAGLLVSGGAVYLADRTNVNPQVTLQVGVDAKVVLTASNIKLTAGDKINLGDKLITSINDVYSNIHNLGANGVGDSGNVPISGPIGPWTYPSISSGSFTLSNSDFISPISCTLARLNPCSWMRVGNVVNVSGQINLHHLTASAAEFKLKIPIESSFGQDGANNDNNDWQLSGVGRFVDLYGGSGTNQDGYVSTIQAYGVSGATQNYAHFKFKPSATLAGGGVIVYNYQYTVGFTADTPVP